MTAPGGGSGSQYRLNLVNGKLRRVEIGGAALLPGPRRDILLRYARNPIENLRRRHRLLRGMWIQRPSNHAPAILDHLLSKFLRIGLCLKLAGRSSGPALSIVALGRDVRTIRNIPDIGIFQVTTLTNHRCGCLGKRQLIQLYYRVNFTGFALQLP